MNIQDAVLAVVKYARNRPDSPTLLADSVRAVWGELTLTPEAATELMQAGLRQTANFPVLHRNAKTITVDVTETVEFDSGGPMPVTVRVDHTKRALRVHEVTCEWLTNTKLTVPGGERKPISEITLREWQARVKFTGALANSAESFNNAHAFIINKLVTFGKKTVGDLGEGEQLRIAREFLTLLKKDAHPVLK